MDGLIEYGLALIGNSLQALSPGLDDLMNGASFLGTSEFYLILLPLVFWSMNPKLGMRALLVLLLADSFTNIGKIGFHQPRPYWLGDERVQLLATSDEPSYGFPSGHASGTFSMWFYLAWYVMEEWLWALAIIVVLLVGFSRMYLGVHFPHDVLAGWTLGLIVIVAFVKLDGPVKGWLNRQPLKARVGVVSAAGVLLALLGVVVAAMVAGVPDPEQWAEFATHARNLDWAFTDGGVLAGGLAGYMLLRERSRFDGSGTFAERAGRFLVGFVGVLLCWRGLDVVFGLVAEDGTALGYLLRFVRYGLTGFWITFGAIWVFERTKLFVYREPPKPGIAYTYSDAKVEDKSVGDGGSRNGKADGNGSREQ